MLPNLTQPNARVARQGSYWRSWPTSYLRVLGDFSRSPSKLSFASDHCSSVQPAPVRCHMGLSLYSIYLEYGRIFLLIRLSRDWNKGLTVLYTCKGSESDFSYSVYIIPTPTCTILEPVRLHCVSGPDSRSRTYVLQPRRHTLRRLHKLVVMLTLNNLTLVPTVRPH